MQIDGHHTLTYVVSRLAGLSDSEAQVVSYAAQYVDEATNAGAITFDNDAMYHRTASAHKMLDYRNSKELANRRVWLPFHFLPGNGGLPAGQNPNGSFIRKLICCPDSPSARDMLRALMADRHKPYALHRLGITLHVYADTFAHQGFAGINHAINEVRDLRSTDPDLDTGFWDKITSYFVGNALPLGHGSALCYPDLPYISWSYTNGLGEAVDRDNLQTFCEAADKMYRVVRCYIAKDGRMDLENQQGLPAEDAATIRYMLEAIKEEDSEKRHQRWLQEIANSRFSFGPAQLEFIPKGAGSWKHAAIQQEADTDKGDERFSFTPEFLSSDWKLFHDALQVHRFDVLHDVLPAYGISAA